MKNLITVFFVALLVYLALSSVHSFSKPATLGVVATPTPVIFPNNRSKTYHCQTDGALPDKGCTPGAVFSQVAKDQICTPGYSKNVRNVPVAIKDEVYREYGILTHTSGTYEVDHLISLELGGSNDIANLWPEPADPTPGFRQKDKVENYLHDQVCQGKMDLKTAQVKIASNWLAIYSQLP